MDLPQELINSIVDAIADGMDLIQDPWIINKLETVHVARTLRSCALVARPFVRPCQHYLFHGFTVTEYAVIYPPHNEHRPPLAAHRCKRIYPEALSALLATRPHLATYVRALAFENTEMGEHLDSISHILAGLTNLTRVDLHPHRGRE
ncbi:hypothetical protein DFH09DRAFT_1309296 [Mycena vulgaris]|nr:hypothetical protein DFH09DRAFT_1309296 [Mycena vulgaris]